MLNFVLPTKKRLVDCSFVLDIFQISWQPRRIRKNRNHQNFLLMQGYFSKVSVRLVVGRPRFDSLAESDQKTLKVGIYSLHA